MRHLVSSQYESTSHAAHHHDNKTRNEHPPEHRRRHEAPHCQITLAPNTIAIATTLSLTPLCTHNSTVLEYYTDENQTTKKGEVVLSGATLVAASDKTCMFAIEEPSTTQRLGSVYVIRAGSEEEREQWVRALGTFMLDVPNWLRVRTSAQILDDAVEASLGDCTSALMALNPGIRRTTVEAALRAHKGDVNAASQSIKKHNPELVNLGRQG